MDFLKRTFGSKRSDEGVQQADAKPLRIGGTKPVALTPGPDDAELAVQALLEIITRKEALGRRTLATEGTQERGARPRDARTRSDERTAEYYRMLADRMRRAHDQATMRAMRFLAWCEQELPKHDLPLEGKDSLQQMEVELYKRIDTVERAGGELKRRWQHCLAEVIVRQMTARNAAVGEE